jgi:hypothetical protein
LDALRSVQNPDGGWGFFPGKQSWLEPTVYAALALSGTQAADSAWALLSGWQEGDGGWRPSADVRMSTWGTALCVTLASTRGELGEPYQRGVKWLLSSAGVETKPINRLMGRLGLLDLDRDLSHKAWPWKPGTTSWVEPTAHALVALKNAAVSWAASFPGIQERIRMGDAQLMDVRCSDGGWNYGSRAALGVDLPSYPETTALALLGLQGRALQGRALQGKAGVGDLIDLAARLLPESASSPLARAWLTIGLRLYGRSPADLPAPKPSPDISITAIEALAAPEGNYHLLKTGWVETGAST